ncbi:MAG: mechanosensitive ion channel family protein [Acidimicrobiia bacterium]|nr:mechanosensitive ion channel family protein [Acidimicrobiia bacterium]
MLVDPDPSAFVQYHDGVGCVPMKTWIEPAVVRPHPHLTAQETDIDTLRNALGGQPLTWWDWGKAGIIIVVAVVGSRVVKFALKRLLASRWDGAVVDLLARLVGYAIVTFGIIYALEQLGVQVGPLLGALGIVGIALAFALQDILQNFLAGLLLQIRRPFSYGDQISSGDIQGTVESIDARSVTLVTPDGETVHMPSSQVITGAIYNHTQRGRRRSTVEIGVAYGSDLDRVKTTFLEAVTGLDPLSDSPPPEVLFTGFGDSSIDFVVRFWHPPTIADSWKARDAVGLALDKAAAEAGIEIPFPQRVITQLGGTQASGS